MQEFQRLKEHFLFSGMSCEEIERISRCFHFIARRYRRNEYILMEGDAVRQIGIIVSGEILMEKEDILGESCFFIKLQSGDLFGDMFIGEQIYYSTVNYRALTECEIVWFQYRTLWEERERTGCPLSEGREPGGQGAGRYLCDCHLKFIENLTGLLAVKTRRLLAKVEILSTPFLRRRILTCLRILGERSGDIAPDKASYTVEVPFDKTGFAEFLCVNRSALMRELSRMKAEGVLHCEGKRYTVCLEPEGKN